MPRSTSTLYQHPPLSQCEVLVNAIFAIADQQHDAPILWSEHPSAAHRSRQLPHAYNFLYVLRTVNSSSNGTTQDGEDNIFPTRLIAGAVNRIVARCLDRGIVEPPTIGAELVGPRGVIAVALRKRIVNGEWVSGGLHTLNLTIVRLSEPGGPSGVPSSLVEDG